MLANIQKQFIRLRASNALKSTSPGGAVLSAFEFHGVVTPPGVSAPLGVKKHSKVPLPLMV